MVVVAFVVAFTTVVVVPSVVVVAVAAAAFACTMSVTVAAPGRAGTAPFGKNARVISIWFVNLMELGFVVMVGAD